MTKFPHARPPAKGKLSLLSKSSEKLSVPTSQRTGEPSPDIGVRFVLIDGTSLKARSNDLEEDDVCIYGTLFSGKSFAVPINNVLYCMEI